MSADSPQTVPTDLSIKSSNLSKKNFLQREKKIRENSSESSIKTWWPASNLPPEVRMQSHFKSFEVDKVNESNETSERDAAIRKAIAAISQSLPVNKLSDVGHNVNLLNQDAGNYLAQEIISSSDDEVSFVSVGNRYTQERLEMLNRAIYTHQPRKRKRSDGSISSSSSSAQSPEFLNALQDVATHFMPTTCSLNANNNNKSIKDNSLRESNTISVISQASKRPTHLNLSGSNVASSVFNTTPEHMSQPGYKLASSPRSLNSNTPTTPNDSGSNSPTQKRRRRKLGPGRGWKFHDLSNDGGTKKKRAYAQNRLENDILQKFQDRVCVKTVSSGDGSTEKLVIVEPSEIIDADLVLSGTSLRLLFDKENGIYKLQVLPYTIEEGHLNSREQVLSAVSKMLGDNGETLCPTAFSMLSRIGSQIITRDMTLFGSETSIGFQEDCLTSRRNSMSTSVDKRSITGKFGKIKNDRKNLTKNQAQVNSKDKTDDLLRSINNELVRNNTIQSSARNKCLIWHSNGFNIPGRKPRNVPSQRKWCIHCRNISTPL